MSDEAFNQHILVKQIAKGAMDWGKLPTNVVYRVQTLVPLGKELERKTLLQLVNRENTQVKVWAPRNIVNDLTVGMEIHGKEAYIRSFGQKERKFRGEKIKYFDFETVYVPKENHANVVVNEEQSEEQKLGKVGGEKLATAVRKGVKRKLAPLQETVPSKQHSKVDINRLIDGSGVVFE